MNMYLILWILSFPTVLYHCFFTLLIISLFLYHKIYRYLFKSSSAINSIVLIDKGMYNRKLNKSTGYSSLVAIVVVALISKNGVSCLESDATLIRPIAGVAKSLISAITLGAPTPIEFQSTELVKSLVSFSWRTGFPITMPTDFLDRAKDFYNRIHNRVLEENVENLQRKRLSSLKVDLDNIVDSIVEEVRQSPVGLYTDYLQIKVNGTSLEEACYNVGLQLKAYGVDISNYRNIAGMVLGVPVVPTVASHMVNAAKVSAPVTKLPGAALNAVSSMSGSALNSLSNLSPIPNPMSNYFGRDGSSSTAPSQLVETQAA